MQLLLRILLLPFLLILTVLSCASCATSHPVGRSCTSRPEKGGAVCIGPDGKSVCQAKDAAGKCTDLVTPYRQTNGMLMFDPEEYKARIRAAEKE